MADLLESSDMERSGAACLVHEAQTLRSGVQLAALRTFHHLFDAAGALERGEFRLKTYLGERTAGTLPMALQDRGLLVGDPPPGRVRFGLPQHVLHLHFPALWPEKGGG